MRKGSVLGSPVRNESSADLLDLPSENGSSGIDDTVSNKLGDDYSTDRDYNEDNSKTVADHCSRWGKKIFTMKRLRRHFPFLSWMPKYSTTDLKGDCVAGITVALTVIPQGIAYAAVAGLPPQYGLYTAFIGCFVYIFFGSSKDLTIGPTAIMSLMTAQHKAAGGITFVILLTFLCGCIQLLMGLLNLGCLVDFISGSVISAFTSAAAVTITVSQIKDIFGLKFQSDGFMDTIYKIFLNIGDTRIWDFVMGICCIAILTILRHFKNLNISSESCISKFFKCIWWCISTGKNALIVICCALVSALLLAYNIDVFSRSESVEGQLPPFELPSFSYHSYNNATNTTVNLDFVEIVHKLGSAVIIIPLIGILESIAIAKAFAKGKRLDATQEMIALGLSNIAGSFVHAYPATGSFSRTVINHHSGVRTPLGGLFTGSLVLLALGVVAPYFEYIPKAALAGMIIVSVVLMIHYEDIPVMWRTDKIDLIPYTATFVSCCVIGLEYGIMIGVGISLLILLYQFSRPKLEITTQILQNGHPVVKFQPDRSLYFPGAEYFKSKVTKAIPGESDMTVMVDGTHIIKIDYTALMAIKNLTEGLRGDQIRTVFTNLRESALKSLQETLGSEFCYIETREDLLRAVKERFKTSLNNVNKENDSAVYTASDNVQINIDSISDSPEPSEYSPDDYDIQAACGEENLTVTSTKQILPKSKGH